MSDIAWELIAIGIAIFLLMAGIGVASYLDKKGDSLQKEGVEK